MTDRPYLSDEELFGITHVRQGAAQCRHLARMGIPFRPRADGTPLVLRAELGRQQVQQGAQPRWSRAA